MNCFIKEKHTQREIEREKTARACRSVVVINLTRSECNARGLKKRNFRTRVLKQSQRAVFRGERFREEKRVKKENRMRFPNARERKEREREREKERKRRTLAFCTFVASEEEEDDDASFFVSSSIFFLLSSSKAPLQSFACFLTK